MPDLQSVDGRMVEDRHPIQHKGAYGVDYRTKIGLHMLGPASLATLQPSDPAWDVYVGPLPFLMAPSDERPYLRESVQPRRERFDSARDPGENSLDSSLWIRSQTSWHLGAGQPYSEPLESEPEVARFRFSRSAGMDPWTPGVLSLLPAASVVAGTGMRQCIGMASGLVVARTTTGVLRVVSNGSTTSLSTKVLSKMALSDDRWWGLTGTHLEWGDLSGATGAGQAALAGGTAIGLAMERMWVGAGSALYEVSIGTPTVGTPFHTFKDGEIADIDSGAGGLYVLVNGSLSRIYVITARDDGTLNVPREVAVLPRGEAGTLLYGYLGSFMVIGTSRGVRVADCSTSADLIIGPLTLETASEVRDAVGVGNFMYVTTGSEGIQPDPAVASTYPGLYRIDLSRPIERGTGNATRYAWATDLCGTSAGLGGESLSVTYSGAVWFVANDRLWRESTAKVPMGWVDSGQVSFSTAERKSWTSIGMDVTGSGSVDVWADDGNGMARVTQTQVKTPLIADLAFDTMLHETSGWLEHRILLYGDGTAAGSPTLQSVALRATPAPRRTRMLRIPLLCFDEDVDRNGSPVGYEGFSLDRLIDLESMESQGALVDLTDLRTNEVLKVQIERVQYENSSAPSRARANSGGFLTLTVLVV